jgi:predicted acetyltransferase
MLVAQTYVDGCEQDFYETRQLAAVKPSPVVELIRPTADMRVEFLTMAKEYQCLHDDRYADAIADFTAYLGRLENWSQGKELPEGYVQSDTFWLVQDGSRILGCSRLRHRLTPWLENEGGHIGYDIRPLERHKGYGTRILELTLKKARQAGLDKVLVTCDRDNIASAKIIEENGGRLENQTLSPDSGKAILRYWIEL